MTELADGYASALRGLADARGDAPRYNRLVDEAQRCHLELRATPEGRAAIEALLDDPDPEVRGWAAAHVLMWNPRPAKKVLKRLKDDSTADWSVQVSADMTLREYKAGRLTHDWQP